MRAMTRPKKTSDKDGNVDVVQVYRRIAPRSTALVQFPSVDAAEEVNLEISILQVMEAYHSRVLQSMTFVEMPSMDGLKEAGW